MVMLNPKALAAELRLRARDAEPHERADLLFLANEYEKLAEMSEFGDQPEWPGVPLPK